MLNNRGQITKTVSYVFLFYTLIYYFIPFLFSLIWWSEFCETYKMSDGVGLAILIPFVILLVYVLDALVPKINLGISKYLGYIFYNPIILSLFSVGFLGTSIWFFKNFSTSFRHHNELSEAGGLAMILFALKAYFRVYLFGLLLKYSASVKFNRFEKTMLLLMVFCFSFSMAGSFDVFYILSSSLLLFDVKKLLGKIESRKKSITQTIRQTSLVFGVLLVAVTVLFVGTANKIGTEEALALFSDSQNITFLFQRLILRLSTMYVSFLAAGDIFFKDPFFAMEAISGTAKNSFLRIGVLIGENFGQKPEIWSINRLNYLNIFLFDDRERTGATPGIFSMLFYFPFFPISIFIVSAYILYVLRLISKVLIHLKTETNIFFILLVTINVAPLFENPLSYINFLDTAFLYFLFLVANISHVNTSILKSQKRNHVVKN